MVGYKNTYQRYQRYYHNVRRFYKKPVVKNFAFLTLSLLTTALFGFFAVKPSLKTIAGLVKEIKEKKMISQKLEQKINALSAAQKEYASIQPELPIIYAVLPKESNFSRLAEQIEYLSRKSDISLLNFQIKKANLFPGKEEKLTEVDFGLNIGGEYKNLKSFLEDLGKLNRLVTVEAIDFSKEKISREKTEFPLTLKVSAKGYYLP